MYMARIVPLFNIFLLLANLNQPSSWGPPYVSSSFIHPFNSSEMYDDKYLKPPRSEIYQRFACSNLFPPLFMTFVEHLWAFYHSLPKGGVFHLYPASFREWRSFALPRFPPNERSAFGARGFAPPSELWTARDPPSPSFGGGSRRQRRPFWPKSRTLLWFSVCAWLWQQTDVRQSTLIQNTAVKRQNISWVATTECLLRKECWVDPYKGWVHRSTQTDSWAVPDGLVYFSPRSF